MGKQGEYARYFNSLRVSSREYARMMRIEALNVLGAKCSTCGFSDFRALQIDHINGDGKNETTKGSSYSRKVIKSVNNGERRFQLLCANCNFIKRSEKNENGSPPLKYK